MIKNEKSIKICSEVKKIYDWLDENIKKFDPECSACGKCCDFASFGHKLFITSPELLYFFQNVKPLIISQQSRDHKGAVKDEVLSNPSSSSCPYLKDGKCTARDFRFAGCRIFFCKADSEKINELSEQAIKKFKALCDEYNFPYRYMELASALNNSQWSK
jgi:Fe-S-cluster containining protein